MKIDWSFPEGPTPHALRHRVLGQHRRRRQLRRLPRLQHLADRAGPAARQLPVPRPSERRRRSGSTTAGCCSSSRSTRRRRTARLVCSQNRSSDTTACGTGRCFEGIRIFDLTTRRSPVYLKGVYTDCGSHTHTLVPDLANNRLLLYISSYPGSSGPRCQSPFRKISIVAGAAGCARDRRASSPSRRSPTNVPGCHDMTGFLAINKMAASCASEGQLWDISEPGEPGHAEPGAHRRRGCELLALGRVHVGRPVRGHRTTRASPAPASRTATGRSASSG